tara:strand:+ start:855 stop:1451 length:597 start_codon:yes stop_codon:yes gene_type:complete
MSYNISYIKQRRNGFGIGQCTEATTACLLGLDPKTWEDEVPDLYTGDMKNPRSKDRQVIFNKWLLEEHGKVQAVCHFAPRKFPFDPYSLPFDVENLPWDFDFHAMMGLTPCGVPHMLVGKRGYIFWDTNIQSKGIVKVHGFQFLLSEAQMEKEKWSLFQNDEPGSLIIISGEEHMNPHCIYKSDGTPKENHPYGYKDA